MSPSIGPQHSFLVVTSLGSRGLSKIETHTWTISTPMFATMNYRVSSSAAGSYCLLNEEVGSF